MSKSKTFFTIKGKLNDSESKSNNNGGQTEILTIQSTDHWTNRRRRNRRSKQTGHVVSTKYLYTWLFTTRLTVPNFWYFDFSKILKFVQN